MELPTLRADDASTRAWRELGARLAGSRPYPAVTDARFADVPARTAETIAASDDVATVLIGLFATHSVASFDAVTGVLAPFALAPLLDAGLLARDGDNLVAQFQIQRWADVFVVCDWFEHHEEDEYVHGVTNAGRTLAYLTPRRAVVRAFDLGTGCGLQAVLAARHADEVVASDVNPRAVAMARATAWLNDATNVELRTGSWFDPVAGEHFDLIVANPPYVISPEQRLVYRDSETDELCGSLLAHYPSLLRDGGLGVMLANWAQRTKQTWTDVPERWLAPLDAVSVAIKFVTLSPFDYAQRWNAELRDSPREFATALASWLEFYSNEHIEALVLGAIGVTARPSAFRASWFPVEAAHEVEGPGGAQLARMLAGAGASRADRTSDRAVPVLAADHELRQRLRFVDGVHVADNVRLAFPGGLGVEAEIAPDDVVLILAIDGARDIASIVNDLRDTEVAPDLTVEHATRVLLELAAAGFVEMVDPEAPTA